MNMRLLSAVLLSGWVGLLSPAVAGDSGTAVEEAEQQFFGVINAIENGNSDAAETLDA